MDRSFLRNEVDTPEFTQSFTNVTSVVVPHNLGYKPDVWIEDSAGKKIGATVTHNSTSQFTVTFAAAETGVVHYR